MIRTKGEVHRITVKYKMKDEYPLLKKNAKKAKMNISEFARSRTLQVKCLCHEK